jgi:hypothetical protein
MQVLIAFPRRDEVLAEEIDEQLSVAARKRRLPLQRSHIANHAARAAKILTDKALSHCVVHDELPVDLNSEPACGGAFALAGEIQRLRPGLPILVLHARATWLDSELERMSDLKARAVRNSAEGIASIVDRVLDVGEVMETAEITIDLSPRAITYAISGGDLPQRERSGQLKLLKYRFGTFRELSKRIEVDENWNDVMQSLSSDLCGSLVEENPEFRAALRQVLKGDGITNRSRLHFRVHPDEYEVAFETIQYPDDASFWMLRTPVFRSLAGSTEPPPPIFQDAQSRPLKCLIVLSAAAGSCTYLNNLGDVQEIRSYADLRQARGESDGLRRLLESARNSAVDDVVLLGCDAPLGVAELKSTLDSREWDIVHYIGHSDFRDPRGYLILPGARPSEPQAVGVEEIAPHLAHARFVYLSSCEGTKLAFVRRLAEHGVPNILGFRSRVRDDLARQHALYFYEQLFALHSIERAFLAARQEFHRNWPKERLWACSSLVMQRA